MKKRIASCAIPLFMGIMFLSYVMTKPRFDTYKGSDVVTLVSSGALLAVGLGLLFGRVRPPSQ